jgi:hypothetical protein
MNTKIKLSEGLIYPVPKRIVKKVEIHENNRSILHWSRAWLFGECPLCHSTHNKQIPGWNKLMCEKCGNTWLCD